MTRHEIREAEFLLLFEKTFHKESIRELTIQHENNYGFQYNEEIEKTAEEIINNLPEIDSIIKNFSPLRSLSRISKVNLSAIRLAIFEILYRSDKIPINAAANEAVGLVKTYGLDSDVKFVNGVLGAFIRSLKENV